MSFPFYLLLIAYLHIVDKKAFVFSVFCFYEVGKLCYFQEEFNSA